MKKKLLGITALFAVLTFAMMFTTCDALGAEKDDGIERTVIFENFTQAEFTITCQGSPSSFKLGKAPAPGQKTTQTVTRTGFDIVLTTLDISDPRMPDPWTYVELSGSAVAGNSKGKNGLALKAGFIQFYPAAGLDSGPNPIGWKVTIIPQDE